jgi:hypothetical protein
VWAECASTGRRECDFGEVHEHADVMYIVYSVNNVYISIGECRM